MMQIKGKQRGEVEAEPYNIGQILPYDKQAGCGRVLRLSFER